MPEVSIIIPTYTHGHLIEETLESVLKQTFQDFEIIVINDGSPDHTEQVLMPYIQSQKIKYFSQENQGMAAARNVGMSHASGRYLVFLDDDDVISPDKLEWQLQAIQATNAVMIVGANDFIGKKSKALIREDLTSSVELKVTDFFYNNPITTPGQVLIQRWAMDEIGGFDPTIWGADDLDLWIKLAGLGKILKYQKIALHYRVHANNMSKNVDQMVENTIKVLRKHLPQLEESQRKSCEKQSSYFIFRYGGKKILREAAHHLWCGNFHRAFERIQKVYTYLYPQVKKDWYLNFRVLFYFFKYLLKGKSLHKNK